MAVLNCNTGRVVLANSALRVLASAGAALPPGPTSPPPPDASAYLANVIDATSSGVLRERLGQFDAATRPALVAQLIGRPGASVGIVTRGLSGHLARQNSSEFNLVELRELEPVHPIASSLARDLAQHLTDRIQALHLWSEESSLNHDGGGDGSPPIRQILPEIRRSIEAAEYLLSNIATANDLPRSHARSLTTNLSSCLRRMAPLLRTLARGLSAFELEVEAATAMVSGTTQDLTRLCTSLVYSIVQRQPGPNPEPATRELALKLRCEPGSCVLELHCHPAEVGDPSQWPTPQDAVIARDAQISQSLELRGDRSIRTLHFNLVEPSGALHRFTTPRARTRRLALAYSGSDSRTRNTLAVAAQRVGGHLDTLPLDVALPDSSSDAWIIDLCSCDLNGVSSILAGLGVGSGAAREGPLPFRIIFILPRSGDPARGRFIQQTIRPLLRLGALSVREPLSVEHAVGLLDDLGPPEGDVPWYRIYFRS